MVSRQRRGRPGPQVKLIRRIDEDRAIAHVDLPGGICLKSLWILGLKGSPEDRVVSWPRTARGFPILTAPADLKDQIDAAVLEAVR